MRKKIIFAAFMVFLGQAGLAAAAGQWSGVAVKIRTELNAALRLYEQGNVQDAEEKAVDAYFGLFEGEKANMEVAVRQHLSFKRAAMMEKGFSDIRRLMHAKAPANEVKGAVSSFANDVSKAADELDGKG